MKLDLSKEKEKIRKYILKRISSYRSSSNSGPGRPKAPIQMMVLGFYAAQGGYVYLVFDTRPGFNLDGEWNNHISEDTMLDLPRWCHFYERVCEQEKSILVNENGRTISIHVQSDEDSEDEDDCDDSDLEDEINSYFGNMLTNLMLELRDDGSLASMPLAKDAFMIIEEFDGHYFWPLPETCRSSGRIAKK